MKSLLIAMFLVQAVAVSANAKEVSKARSKAQRICDSFQAKEDLECAHIMCDDDIANGTWKDLDDCTSAEDYQEAAQGGCDGQSTTVDVLVKKYNRKHPTAKIKCE
jgi:glycogen debranching enzyme